VVRSYGRLFTTPGTTAFVTAGFVARTAHLMTALGILFLLVAVTGSYGLAGAVSAAYALSYSVASPWISRMVDVRRQSWVLSRLTGVNTACRVGLLLAVWWRTPGWSLLIIAALCGATMPAIGALTRARWYWLFGGTRDLDAALSFESVVDEVILIVGPVAVSMLAVYLHPAGGLVMATVFAAVGSAALAALRRTEPPARPRSRASRGSILSAPGFRPLVLAFVALGAGQSSVDLATIAFATAHDAKALSGWILAVLAVGSASAGLWYGGRRWTSPPERRLVVSLVMATAGMLLFAVGWTVWFLFVAAFLLGLTTAPAMIAGFSVVHRAVPARRLTEAFTWLTAAVGVGVSVGSALAGKVLDAWGTRYAFVLAVFCGAAATLAALAAAAALRRRGPVAEPSTTDISGPGHGAGVNRTTTVTDGPAGIAPSFQPAEPQGRE
jgi:hypothetical protein